MNIVGRLTLAAGLVAVSSSAMSEVRVVGNKRVDTSTISDRFRDLSGPITDAQKNDVLKALYETGQFDNVTINREGHAVLVEVTEAPLVARIRFEGNERLKSRALTDAVKIKTGTIFREADIQENILAISTAYNAVARADAAVTSTVVPLGDNRVEIVFTIDEGVRVGVGNIWFKGNESFSEAELRSVIATKESGIFSRFLNNDIYDVDRVEGDKAKLRDFYLSKGFAAVRILLSDVDRFEDGFVVGFVVDEGPRYVVSAAKIDSSIPNYDGSTSGIASLDGKALTPHAISTAEEKVAADTLRHGIPSAVVTSRIDSDADGKAAVIFAINEGAKLYIQRIDIEGNIKTRDYVIRRELDFSEGDLLNKVLIARAERRLKALGIFDKVSVSAVKGDADDKTILRIDVVEKKTGEWSIGGGYSTTDGPLFSASIAQGNLFGSGRKVRFGAGKGEDSYSFNFSFSEPYLFGNRITSETSLFLRDGERKSDDRHAYDERLTGGKFGLTAPISENIDATVYYGISYREVSDVRSRFSGVGTATDPDLIRSGNFLKSSVGYKLNYNALDDRFNPTEGWNATFEQEFAGIGGDVRFLKSEASVDWYTNLIPSKDLVGHLGGKAGHIDGLGKALDFADHFRTGTTTVRGFSDDGFGPRDSASGYHLGGTMMVAGTAEAIMPVPFIPQTYGLKGVVFTDFGSVWDPDSRRVSQSGSDVSSSDASLRASIGTGVLWNSPFGQIRADFAVPIIKKSGDDTQVFSFSGGTKF